MEDKIQLFEAQQIRTAWDEHLIKWSFSVLDIMTILTDQSVYKVVSIANQLKLMGHMAKYD